MTTERGRTVWFSADSLIQIVGSIPVWGIAGLGWGSAMAFTMKGSLIGWLITGLFWGASMWFVFAIYLFIMHRGLSIRVPVQETTTLPERLAEAVKPLRYKVEQESPSRFVCKPRQGLAHLLSIELNYLHVQLQDDGVELSGPAIIVYKVRKKLLAAPSMRDK